MLCHILTCSKNADVNCEINDGFIPLWVCQHRGCKHCARWLTGKGYRPTYTEQSSLMSLVTPVFCLLWQRENICSESGLRLVDFLPFTLLYTKQQPMRFNPLFCVHACVLPYSTLRATRCVKSPTVSVEKMLPVKFLFVEKKNRQTHTDTQRHTHTPFIEKQTKSKLLYYVMHC